MLAQLSKQTKRMAATAVLVFCFTSTGVARADDFALYQKTLQATGWIYGVGDGTCWVVDRDERLVITNRHVVGTKDEVEVFFPMFKDGQLVTEAVEYLKRTHLMIKGTVIARDAKRDLALVQLDSLPENVGVLTLAQTSAKVNDWVLSVGNSGLAGKPLEQGTLWKQRTGKVVNKYFRQVNYGNVNQMVQSSMLNSNLRTSPGDSGGPVVNEKGELVGVTSGGNNVDSFAIDVTEVRTFLERSKESGRRPPVSVRVLTGAWTQSWISGFGSRQVAGLTLRVDGTVLFEDMSGAYEGTYTLADGRLTLVLPGLGRSMTAEVNWIDSDTFRFVRDGIEYTMERR